MFELSTGIFLRARNASTRLPGKHMLEINGIPMIQRVIERVKNNTKIPNIILCTTEHDEDNILEQIATDCGIKCFRGHDTSVLRRYCDALDFYKYKNIVNIDCDDVLFDYTLIDRTAMIMNVNPEIDYLVWNGYPLGCTVTGMSVKGLRQINQNIHEDVEHIFKHFEGNTEFRKLYMNMDIPSLHIPFLNKIRLTLDYYEDYIVFKDIIESEESCGDGDISFESVMDYIKNNPEIVDINYFRNDDFYKHQRE